MTNIDADRTNVSRIIVVRCGVTESERSAAIKS